MITPFDRNEALPAWDLFDNDMIRMAISAAKDEYDTAKKDLREFMDKYGDFYSPIQRDMDWYKENVTDKFLNTIDDLYTRGIDPLRTPEGRAAVRLAVNSVNVGEIAEKKRAAEAAQQYIKNRDVAIRNNTYNPDYERAQLGGQLLEEWDGKLGNWKATQVSPYMDYEQKYGHLFDKMGYEYDPEESAKYPGMNVMTKSKKRMHDILSLSRPDLITDPQYMYDLNRLKLSIKLTNPDIDDATATAEAVSALENEIVSRNYKGGMLMTEDPIAKELREFLFRKRLAAMNRSAGVSQQPNNSNQWSFAEIVRRSGPTAILGKQVQEYTEDMPGQQRDAQLNFGLRVTSATNGRSYSNKGILMYKQLYGQNIYRKSDIIKYLQSMGYRTTSDGMSVVIPKEDIKKLSSLKSLASNTTGYQSNHVKTPRKDLEDADIIIYTPSGGSYQAFMKNSRNEAHFEGTVKAYKYKTTESGDLQTDDKGNFIVDKNDIKTKTLYIDSDIKSVKNDPRLGGLSGPKKQKVVNTLDTRYQNAIISDKETTDAIIKGTDYGSDAILSEEPYYGM